MSINMHPLNWGGGTNGKDPKISSQYLPPNGQREVRQVIHITMIKKSFPCLREAVRVRMSSELTIDSG